MSLSVRVLLALIIGSVGMSSLAEEVEYLGGKRKIVSVAEKVQRSRAQASFAAIGRFVRLSAEPVEPLDAAKGLLPLEFRVTRALAGRDPAAASVIRLKLPVYLGAARPANASGAGAGVISLEQSHAVEYAVSGSIVVFQQYLDALHAARAPLLSEPSYMPDFVVVPVTVGGLDAPHRTADVVVQFARNYVVFFMREVPAARTTTLFPPDIDIYGTDEPEVAPVTRNRP